LRKLRKSQEQVSIVSVQNRYNLEDRSSEDLVEYCQRNNIAFNPWFPLEAGRHATAAAVRLSTAELATLEPAAG
jgi:aryl-alcohol dehydrogenase-like predicted oxidoreductase